MTTVGSWRDEARQDRLLRAQIDQEREVARSQARIAERQAAVEARLQAGYARDAARQRARHARAGRRAALAAWMRSHTVDLLFVPVIGVPAALAWTGMADYGLAEYGPPGLALPALSEGGMWAFAAATTITRHKHPDKPVWHLRVGTVVFAAYGAALNSLHGLAVGGVLTGVTMALVSVAGVTAHQLVTAGPRRSRAEREQARLGNQVARRERAARRAAVRHALVDLDEDGNARLVFEPGLATLARRRGRTRLEDEPPAAQTVPPDAAEATRIAQRPDTDEEHIAQPPPQPALLAAQDESCGTESPVPGSVDATRLVPPDADRIAPEPEVVYLPFLDPNREEDGDNEYTKALKAMRRTTLAGNPLSGRQLTTRYKLSRSQVTQIVDLVSAVHNGHTPEEN